jgi:MYND finger
VCFVCSSPSVQRCSKCNAVYYCGQRCQLSHWSTHKKVDTPLLSAPHTSCAVATFSLHAVRQMDTRSLSVEVTYFLRPLSLKLLPCLSSIYLSFKRFLCSLFLLLPPSYLFHSLPLSLSLSLSGVTQQLCTESCIPHPSRREVRQLITHTHLKITGFEPSNNH